MVYRLSSACAPASRNRNREVLAVPGAYSKSEFGPCAPVVATLLTDWGWREFKNCLVTVRAFQIFSYIFLFQGL